MNAPSDKTVEEFGESYRDIRDVTLELLHEYLDETCHGSCEGFSDEDLKGIIRMFQDIRTYVNHS